MLKRSHFKNSSLPYLLVAPQLAITVVFFLWPASQALYQSLLLEDPFGLRSEFVWFDNYRQLFQDGIYFSTLLRSIAFSSLVATFSMGIALLLAALVDHVRTGTTAYRTLLIWPYAVAPVVAGTIWMFLFDPTLGIVSSLLQGIGYDWNYRLNGGQAMALIVCAATWKQISYNFLFFLAGMQAIPTSLQEAAAIDGACAVRRFWSITLPLLSPTTFFLLVMNIVYAFFDTFGIVHAVTQGGPAKATEILVYKIFNDGFIGLDLGGSAAQSVILMTMVIALTVIQFRYIEQKVEY